MIDTNIVNLWYNVDSGGCMNIDTIKDILNEKGEVQFKLYSLEYVIKNEEDGVVIYPILYEYKKNKYQNIDELFNNYYIFGETIKQNEDKINDIK